MIAITLNLQSRLACSCPPIEGEERCPMCRGESGAFPSINRSAVEAALAIGRILGLQPVRRIEIGRMPDAAYKRKYRIGTTMIAKKEDVSLSIIEGPSGAAQVVIAGMEDIATLADALRPLGELYTDIQPAKAQATLYPAMDLPPIAL